MSGHALFWGLFYLVVELEDGKVVARRRAAAAPAIVGPE